MRACLADQNLNASESERYSGKYQKCYFIVGKNILNVEFPEQKISSQGTNTVLLLDRISSHGTNTVLLLDRISSHGINTVLLLDRISSHGINTVLLLDSVKNHTTYLQQRIRSLGWC